MNKETRAIVLGLFVVVVFALCLSAWRGPAREFRNIKGFQVEVKKTEGDETRAFHFTVPVALLAQLTRLAHIDDALDGDIRAAWDKGDITPRELLDAADESRPDKPSVIKNDDATIEVRQDGDAILVDVQRRLGPRRSHPGAPDARRGLFGRPADLDPRHHPAARRARPRRRTSRSATRTTRSRSRPSRRRGGCASRGSRASAISRCVPPARPVCASDASPAALRTLALAHPPALARRYPPGVANRLALESSPYLLQHKDNPVDWYPWGAEALRAGARRRTSRSSSRSATRPATGATSWSTSPSRPSASPKR